MAEHPLHELVDMVLCHARVDGNVHAACMGEIPWPSQPTRKTLRRARFLETGNVVHRPRQGRPRTVAIEEPAVMVLAAVAANPHTSIRTIEDVGVIRSSVHRILHEHKFHPFYMHCHQALEERDFQARMDFCNWLLCRLDPDFTTNILWFDEAQFSRNGVVNRHNAHYWAENNPR
uniref:Transposase Tc1-like domain-containing protein n=1 Tax=Strigamia maritima TaxID=126957 RepID=T1IK52_STRMM